MAEIKGAWNACRYVRIHDGEREDGADYAVLVVEKSVGGWRAEVSMGERHVDCGQGFATSTAAMEEAGACLAFILGRVGKERGG